MKLYSLHRSQTLPMTLDEAWSFFSDPRNLALITPPSLNFRVTSELPASMYPGMIITYTVTPILNIPWKWVTEITHVAEPHYFVDEQRFGPYRFWHHEHHFRETAEGVEMMDLVIYGLPYGIAGKIALPVIRKRLDGIFDFRRIWLEKRFRR